MDGTFLIPLTQEETIKLATDKGHTVLVEGQFNLADRSVAKSETVKTYISSTLATELVDGNTPSAYQLDEVQISIMDGIIIAHVNVEEVDRIVAELNGIKTDMVETTEECAEATTYARSEGQFANAQGNFANTQGNFAKAQGDYAKTSADEGQAAVSQAISKANEDVSELIRTSESTVSGLVNTVSTAVTGAENATERALQASAGAERVNATVSKNAGITRIEITDRLNQIHVANVLDGEKGDKGDKGDSIKGDKGDKGEDGKDGKDYIITEADYQTIADKVEAEYTTELGGLKEDLGKVNSKVDELANEILLRDIDGTKEGYEKAMRNWFRVMGYGSTPEEITALVTEWYKATREDWNGWVTFSKTSTSSDGVKGGDNADMVCIPSTDTAANRDDYSGNPLFAVTTINWILDEDGNPIISAIKGIHDTFEKNNPEKYVGVMQMSAWTYQHEDDYSYTHGYCSKRELAENTKPLPEAVSVDGTFREYVIHSKYMSTTVNGKMTCCSGAIPTAFNSHNSLIALSNQNGADYSASCVTDWSFLVHMTFIKYGSMTQDNRIQGCVNYNYQYYARVSESNTNRVIINKSEGDNLIVGSSVICGTYNGNADRGQVSVSAFTPNGAVITSIEDVVVDGTTYSAVYLDCEPFDSTANPSASGGTILSTWHWRNGTNDSVLGNDGSIVSSTNGRFPAMIQGIEYSVGGYETMADVILNIENGYYNPRIAKLKRYQATSVTNNMVASALVSEQPAADSWNYIRRLENDGEIFFQTDTTDGSSSKYVRDSFYKNSVSTKTGTREWLAFGRLNYGSGNGGLSSLHGYNGLGNAYWPFLARLSSNGNRGELAS